MEALTPFGVGREYNCRRSGCAAGHLRVMGKRSSVLTESFVSCEFDYNLRDLTYGRAATGLLEEWAIIGA